MGGRDQQFSELEANLVYRVSSRTIRAIQRNPVSKNQKQRETEHLCIALAVLGLTLWTGLDLFAVTHLPLLPEGWD